MRKYLFLLPLLLVACTQKPTQVELTDWQFEYQDLWYDATVPGFIHTDLMAHALIPDPYYGTNEDSVRWVSERPWKYRTTVATADLPKGDTVWLVFDGLAGNAVAFISYRLREGEWYCSEWQLFCDNMFEQCYYPLDSHSLTHCDSLSIELTLNDTLFFANDSAREQAYGIALPDRRAFTRIAPYQQGWDWGPQMKTYGIWQPAYITNRRPSSMLPSSPKGRSWNVELHQETDSIGQSFAFYRGGKKLFIKGVNWIPVHSFPVLDEAQKARYRLLLTSAKEAHFNMIRIWGGGIYEHDYFYDLCDSLGIMVWQDFNFSTMLYPDDDEMLHSITREARQQVARLSKHPCIVLWCGNNEVKNGWEDWGWQGVYHWTNDERARLEHAMDTIFGYPSTASNLSSTSILARAVQELDPLHRPYITTSPLYGWGHPECTTHGDSHYWGVWWGELPFEIYGEKTGRFMSEYGFQSHPLMSTIEQFCPSDQLSIISPTLRNHQKHGRGLQIIDKAMQQYYGFDSQSLSLDDFAYVSQLLQAWGVGYGILCHIIDPRCDGTLYWQLNDCWPVASWSSIDYYGNWKALHYRAQALFDDETDIHYWINYYAHYPKDRTYPEPHYAVQIDSHNPLTVTLTAQSDLYDAYIDTYPHVDGHFERNFVDLMAGHSLTTHFIPADPTAKLDGVEVRVRTLNSLYQTSPSK